MTQPGPTPDLFLGLSQAGWGAVTALAAIGTFLIALAALLLARRQLGLALHQLEDQRQAQVEADRPYVIVNFRPSLATRTIQDLVVENIGRRPALQVRFQITPALTSTLDGDGFEVGSVRILNETTSLIAPGQEIRTVFDSTLQRADRDDLPKTFQIKTDYRDSAGRHYSEESTAEWNVLEGAGYVDVYTVHDVAKALKAVEKQLGALARKS